MEKSEKLNKELNGYIEEIDAKRGNVFVKTILFNEIELAKRFQAKLFDLGIVDFDEDNKPKKIVQDKKNKNIFTITLLPYEYNYFVEKESYNSPDVHNNQLTNRFNNSIVKKFFTNNSQTENKAVNKYNDNTVFFESPKQTVLSQNEIKSVLEFSGPIIDIDQIRWMIRENLANSKEGLFDFYRLMRTKLLESFVHAELIATDIVTNPENSREKSVLFSQMFGAVGGIFLPSFLKSMANLTSIGASLVYISMRHLRQRNEKQAALNISKLFAGSMEAKEDAAARVAYTITYIWQKQILRLDDNGREIFSNFLITHMLHYIASESAQKSNYLKRIWKESNYLQFKWINQNVAYGNTEEQLRKELAIVSNIPFKQDNAARDPAMIMLSSLLSCALQDNNELTGTIITTKPLPNKAYNPNMDPWYAEDMLKNIGVITSSGQCFYKYGANADKFGYIFLTEKIIKQLNYENFQPIDKHKGQEEFNNYMHTGNYLQKENANREKKCCRCVIV